MKFSLIRFLKKIGISVLVISLVLYCFKGILYRKLFKYNAISQRELIRIEDKRIKDDLNFWLETSNTTDDVETIISFAQSYASDDLRYTFGKCSTNPNLTLMATQKTNCIGYSAAFYAVLSYLLEKKGLTKQVKNQHKVANLYFLGFNLHHLFKDPAFKDHDYNVIYDENTHKKYVIDPTLKAYFGIESVREE